MSDDARPPPLQPSADPAPAHRSDPNDRSHARPDQAQDISGARARLLGCAIDLVLRQGPQALTARALAEHASASPSAVNYHFGDRAGLLRTVHDALAARQATWRRPRLANAAHGPCVWAFVAGAVCELAAGTPEQLALLEFAELAFAADAGLRVAARDEEGEQTGFWRAALQALERPPEDAEIWTAVARTATRLALLDDETTAAFAWLGPAMLRLEARLNGHSAPARIHWLAPAWSPAQPRTSRPAGAQRLVNAALKIIAERGLPAVTLRAVADAAGLALGSTTYFFSSKAQIIHAAFTQLREDAAQQAFKSDRSGDEQLRRAVLANADSIQQAIDAVYLAGARNRELREVALELRSLTGRTSTIWLAARHSSYDRLDGFICSLLVKGFVDQAFWTEPADGQRVLRERLDRALQRLFPLGPSLSGDKPRRPIPSRL